MYSGRVSLLYGRGCRVRWPNKINYIHPKMCGGADGDRMEDTRIRKAQGRRVGGGKVAGQTVLPLPRRTIFTGTTYTVSGHQTKRKNQRATWKEDREEDALILLVRFIALRQKDHCNERNKA